MQRASLPRDPLTKILTWESARRWRISVSDSGPVVFTNGVFDLLHPGHITVLDRARREGASLVVGINSDASVKRLKGESRPIRNENERAFVLAGLESVDAVVIFAEDTPLELVTLLEPDIIVKGGDYTPDTIVGAELVASRGGRVVVIPLVPDQSTTAIIERLRG